MRESGKHYALLPAVILVAVALPFVAIPAEPETDGELAIEIPHQKFVLPNGLTLIVHEDDKAPIVAVNVWYHVGSKNEPPGKSGFAHLFEHLMFNGSEHYNDDYFQALERAGATDLNGTTNEDRTNYFQTVPVSALDAALWLESDRMGHLLGAVTQEKLDEQRGVVQNEKRQGENQPYAIAHELITHNTYPEGHPYSRTVIGSMEDLEAASLEDVHEWFRRYYGAANAVIVVAGAIDAETARKKAEKYFGGIAPGPPLARQEVWIAQRTGAHRQKAQDRVPQARVYKVWNVPPWGSADGDYLDLVSDVLGTGKNSRLYRRLVYDELIATEATSYVDLREIGGQFYIEATAQPGVDLKEVENAVEEELARFLESGPTEKELERVKTQFLSRFIRGIERIGGFGGKSDILAMSEVYGGSPDAYQTTMKRVREATGDDLLAAAREWLSDGVYTLEIHPYPAYETLETVVDRSRLPVPGTPPDADFPELERRTLSNGLEIVLAEMQSIPVVNFSLLVDAGYAGDQFFVSGTARLAMDMLDEGTETRTALAISEELALLGAQLGTGSNLDMSNVFLSALRNRLDASLDVFADVILNPTFPEDEFERLQKLQLAQIEREKTVPTQMALRVFPRLLYGEDHAYGIPFTGSGTVESVLQITPEDLARFHRTWFKPNHATLVVVGATTLDEITPKLEERFGAWSPGEVPEKNVARVDPPRGTTVYLMDRPGSQQSLIFAGNLAPPKATPEEIAIEALNEILGGAFTSRINMNLREEKHWAYGAGSFLFGARGQRPFIAYAPVQTDKTKEAMVELSRELQDILGPRPATEEELTKVIQKQTAELAGSWETIGAVGSAVGDVIRYGLRDNYYDTYPDEVRNLTLAQVSTAARRIVDPEAMIWLVIGDRAQIEDDLRELDFGEIRLIDPAGNIIQ